MMLLFFLSGNDIDYSTIVVNVGNVVRIIIPSLWLAIALQGAAVAVMYGCGNGWWWQSMAAAAMDVGGGQCVAAVARLEMTQPNTLILLFAVGDHCCPHTNCGGGQRGCHRNVEDAK